MDAESLWCLSHCYHLSHKHTQTPSQAIWVILCINVTRLKYVKRKSEWVKETFSTYFCLCIFVLLQWKRTSAGSCFLLFHVLNPTVYTPFSSDSWNNFPFTDAVCCSVLMWISFLQVLTFLLQLIISSANVKAAQFDSGSRIKVFCPTVFAFTLFRHFENKPLYSLSSHEVQPNKMQTLNTRSSHLMQLLCSELTSSHTHVTPGHTQGSLLRWVTAALPDKMETNTEKQ